MWERLILDKSWSTIMFLPDIKIEFILFLFIIVSYPLKLEGGGGRLFLKFGQRGGSEIGG